MQSVTADPQTFRWNRAQAWTILGATALLMVWSLIALYWPRSGATGAVQEGGKDLEAYRRIVARVHAGEDYYRAAGDREDGSVGRSVILLVAMVGAFLWCIDGDAFFSQELWAGVLIAVSVGAFAVNRRAGGVSAGLAALALRELALPYVAVCVFLA